MGKYKELIVPGLLVVLIAALVFYGARLPGPMPLPKPTLKPTPVAPVPEPVVPTTDLGRAAVAYAAGFVSLAQRVKDGTIDTKAEAVDSMRAGKDAMAAALDRAFADHSDPEGMIVDAAGLAVKLAEAARALGEVR